MRYIEFTGLPGAGKTTLVRELLGKNKDYYSLEEAYEISIKTALNEQKISKSEIIDLKEKMVSKYKGKYPNSFQTFDKYIKEHTNDENRVSYISNWMKILSEKYITIETYNNLQEGLVLVDEGFLQRTFSIFTPPFPTKEVSEKQVKDYLGKIFIPDTLVLTDASPETCEQRMLKRKEGYPGKYKSLNKKQMLNRIDEMKKVSRIIKDTFESQEVEVIEVNTEGKIESLIGIIDKRIKNKD